MKESEYNWRNLKWLKEFLIQHCPWNSLLLLYVLTNWCSDLVWDCLTQPPPPVCPHQLMFWSCLGLSDRQEVEMWRWRTVTTSFRRHIHKIIFLNNLNCKKYFFDNILFCNIFAQSVIFIWISQIWTWAKKVLNSSKTLEQFNPNSWHWWKFPPTKISNDLRLLNKGNI